MFINEEDWKKEKEEYIKKLKKVDQTLNKFLSIDIGGFIDLETTEKISNIISKNNAYLEKLEKDIFEVAIVGLEKAGKSSFANCLISNYIFPSAYGRCTFTTTQLQFGNNNEAVIEFYQRNEFNNIFQSLLKEIEFKDYERIYFDTLKINDFEYYKKILENENPALYNFHQATTIKDIEDIINGSKEISNFLGKSNLIFKDNINKEVKYFITDHHVSRTVKKITIKSSELEDMKSAVIYDVPGFDSPTKIHKEQTLERLKNADAIILLNSLSDSPNIKGTHLDILHKNIDNDGIKLKEKLFVFGNKIDKQSTEEIRNEFIKTFKEDVLSVHKLVEKNRCFIGASAAYLVSKNIPIDEKNNIEIVNTLKDFKDDNGIEKIKKELINYYKTDRFNILKRKIDNSILSVAEICTNIIEKNEDDFSSYDSRFIDNEIVISLIEDSRNSIKEKLSQLRVSVIKDINDHKYFSNKIEELILNGFKEISENYYEEIRLENSKGITTLISPEKTNISIREKLYNKFKLEFEKIITDIANDKYNQISNDILDLFLTSFKINKSNIYFDEIKNGINSFKNKVIEKISYNPTSFVFLTERFSVDLFEILILHCLGFTDRKDKFKASEQNFYSLSLFFNEVKEDKPTYEQPLIKILLTQLQDKTNEYSKKNIEEDLNKKFEDLDSNFKPRKNLYSKDISSYAEYLYNKNINIDQIKLIITKIAEIGLKNLSDQSIIFSLIDVSIQEIYKGISNTENLKDTYIKNLLENIKPSNTKETVITEINNDINNLRIILKDAVVKAIELEKPFISIINKQIEALKNKVSPDNTSEDKDFSSFVLKYASKIEHERFDTIDKEKALIENKKSILLSMKDLSKELNI
ncbi:MAG: dynamin family protein [Candidatus Sericytochromatia bacterium]